MWGVTVNAHLVTKGADPAAPWSGVNPSTVLGNDIAFDANGAMWVWREPPATSTENKPAARPIPDPPGPPPRTSTMNLHCSHKRTVPRLSPLLHFLIFYL